MTLAELNNYVVTSLTPALGPAESRATSRLLLEDDLGVTPTKLALNPFREIEPETLTRFRRYVEAIAGGMPPQYAVGKALFMGMAFKVTPDTLIPRPETAGLVDIITDRYAGVADLSVCDLGTGSGCIAIALSRVLPFSSVTAVDINSGALYVAQENARELKANVRFVKADILAGLPDSLGRFDIIVSNPPYIAMSEKPLMESRVKDYEPSGALFVPDSSPLEFYSSIASWAAAGSLKSSGTMFFEINPLFASDLSNMLRHKGFSCEILKDSFGKDRYAVCRLSD